MAKITGPWLRGARKKLAGVVLQKGARGGTIAREWVIPKNPQSQLQMAQRIIFATVTQAAKFLKPIVDHSFEGVEYGQASVREFISVNLSLLRQLAAVDFAETPTAADAKMFTTTREISALIPNSYIVARGSLKPPTVSVDRNQPALRYQTVAGSLPVLSSVQQGSTHYFVSVFDIMEQALGVSKNDLFTLVVIKQSGEGYRYTYESDDAPGMQIPYTAMEALRVSFNAALTGFVDVSNDGETVAANISERVNTIVGQIVDTGKSSPLMVALLQDMLKNLTFSISVDGNSRTLSFAASTRSIASVVGSYLFAAAFIKSREVSGSWRRSDAAMTITTPQSGSHNFGLLWAFTVDAWFKGYQVAESEEFLDEGGSENQIG